jgi:hypothetical protein
MPTQEIVEALAPVVTELERLEASYCVSGWLAGAFYGVCRGGLRIDVVAAMLSTHATDFVRALTNTYHVREQDILDAIAGRSSFALVHLATAFKIVVHIPKSRPYDRNAMARIRQERIGDERTLFTFFVPSPEDAVLSQLDWFDAGDGASRRPWQDAVRILKVMARSLDRDYLKQSALYLGVPDLLAKAWKEAETGGR